MTNKLKSFDEELYLAYLNIENNIKQYSRTVYIIMQQYLEE